MSPYGDGQQTDEATIMTSNYWNVDDVGELMLANSSCSSSSCDDDDDNNGESESKYQGGECGGGSVSTSFDKRRRRMSEESSNSSSTNSSSSNNKNRPPFQKKSVSFAPIESYRFVDAQRPMDDAELRARWYNLEELIIIKERTRDAVVTMRIFLGDQESDDKETRDVDDERDEHGGRSHYRLGDEKYDDEGEEGMLCTLGLEHLRTDGRYMNRRTRRRDVVLAVMREQRRQRRANSAASLLSAVGLVGGQTKGICCARDDDRIAEVAREVTSDAVRVALQCAGGHRDAVAVSAEYAKDSRSGGGSGGDEYSDNTLVAPGAANRRGTAAASTTAAGGCGPGWWALSMAVLCGAL